MATQKQKDRIKIERERRAAQRERELAQNTARAYKVPEFQTLDTSKLKFLEQPLRPNALQAKKCKSLFGARSFQVTGGPMLTDEQREDHDVREAAAKKISDRRKKMVAPLCNKAAYTYIGDMPPEIIQGLGRKL